MVCLARLDMVSGPPKNVGEISLVANNYVPVGVSPTLIVHTSVCLCCVHVLL